MASDADDGNGDDEGHDKDQEEDGSDYLDRLFSRDMIWSVVIGGAIWGALSNLIVYAVTWNPAALKAAIGMAAAVPVLVIGGMYWPDFEQKYAHVLPWMDSSNL